MGDTMKRTAAPFEVLFTMILFLAGGICLWGAVSAQHVQKKPPTSVIVSPSTLGEVEFPHQFHFEDLEVECQTCHHETNATVLKMPHADYFEDFWIDCRICHKSDSPAVSRPQACSTCHHDSPTDIADETLSAKVVIHKNCWECHELEKGENASRGCSDCHKQVRDEKKSSLNNGWS